MSATAGTAAFAAKPDPTLPTAQRSRLGRFADLGWLCREIMRVAPRQSRGWIVTSVLNGLALMIPHRLGPARFADRIVVMAHGRIVEQGSHHGLMQRHGPYAEMFAAQADWYR